MTPKVKSGCFAVAGDDRAYDFGLMQSTAEPPRIARKANRRIMS